MGRRAENVTKAKSVGEEPAFSFGEGGLYEKNNHLGRDLDGKRPEITRRLRV